MTMPLYEQIEYLILGAGPSGLAFAHSLLDRGVARDKLLVLESENEPGGLCRSTEVDGAPLDIGGGHFLDLRLKEVTDFLFRFLPSEEWNTYQRVAKIMHRGLEIDHPFEANLWQMDKPTQVDYLESIARAGLLRGEPMPNSFVEWIQWKFGERIAGDYMLPYNRKIWSMDLNKLGTYWLHKLPDVSFREVLRSCLENRAFGSLPAHGTFLYPKNYGYGEVWRRMGSALEQRLHTNTPVQKIDVANGVVNNRWKAKTIITTIPWTHWLTLANPLPDIIRDSIMALEHVSIDVEYFPETLATAAHWIYEPDEAIPHHRKLLRANFFPHSRGYWTETNARRSSAQINFRHRNTFAYPVNTLGKPEALARILEWSKSNGIVGLGRWGTWEHMNSDVTVQQALRTCHQVLNGR